MKVKTSRAYLLEQISQRITTCSNLNPPPVDHIARLQHMRSLVQIATPDELLALYTAWLAMKQGAK